MPIVMPIFGKAPRLGRDVFIAPNATVIGDVELGDEASVWFGAVVRGDIGAIRIGARTNIQDLACVHLSSDGTPESPPNPQGQHGSVTIVGDDCTIGHGAILHGCWVGDRCLVGMGAILLDDVRVGEGSVIGAGALVPPRMVIPPGSLVLGSPARVVRPVRESEARLGSDGAAHYVENARHFLEAMQVERGGRL